MNLIIQEKKSIVFITFLVIIEINNGLFLETSNIFTSEPLNLPFHQTSSLLVQKECLFLKNL